MFFNFGMIGFHRFLGVVMLAQTEIATAWIQAVDDKKMILNLDIKCFHFAALLCSVLCLAVIRQAWFVVGLGLNMLLRCRDFLFFTILKNLADIFDYSTFPSDENPVGVVQ